MPDYESFDMTKKGEDLVGFLEEYKGIFNDYGKYEFVIDTNGTLEECFALFLAMNNPEFKIKGIICCGGRISVQEAVKNVSRIAVHMKQIIPIFKGSNDKFCQDRDPSVLNTNNSIYKCIKELPIGLELI